ncbi:hypothetical protein Tco_0157460 [Tanacetum coccineum]
MYPVLSNNTTYFANSIRRTDLQKIHMAYSNQLNMVYRSPNTVAVMIFRNQFNEERKSRLQNHIKMNIFLLPERTSLRLDNDLTNYIYITRKNFLSDDNKGRMVEKSFLEIQGTFLVKIRGNTFNGTIRENAVEHIENFLKVVKPLKIKGVGHDRFRVSVFPISLVGAASEWFKKDYISSVTTWEYLVEKFVQKFYHLSYNNDEIEADEDDNPANIAEIFKIKGNLFDFKTPLCKAFDKFNYLLKIDANLFTFDIQKIRTYKEHEYRLNNKMTRDHEEPWSDNRVPYQLYYKWYDVLADGVLKEEALIHKARFEESWGDATLGVMKFCAWLKNSFENFHELDHDVLVKLEECWWKLNTHEHAPFTR